MWIRKCAFTAFSSSCFYLLLLLHAAAAAVTHPSEVDALLAVKRSLIDPMNHLWDWYKGDPCTSHWTGIFCHPFHPPDDHNDGFLHISELQFLNMNLSGTLAPELGQLSRLIILDFMWNHLTGSIPKEIGNMSSLYLLLLSGNKLSGPLPDELGYMSNLMVFQIDENQISGPIPKSFANLKSVGHLHFNNNSISGEIPSELSRLSNLFHLLLDNNNLSGHLPPDLSTSPQMRILQLDNNNFRGSEIPASYGNLSTLAKLSLRNCGLQGAIPDLSGITNLKYLDLSHNSLTGGLPAQLSDNITTIDLSDNNLNGTIPATFSKFPFLQRLLLDNNKLSGFIPVFIWQNMSVSPTAKLMIDLRNNLLSDVEGSVNPPDNVTLRLEGNPICSNANARNIGPSCASEAGGDEDFQSSTNSSTVCPIQACPVDNFYEYVPASPVPCFCASPLRIGYRLKSPCFSYFLPYVKQFEEYMTKSLNLDLNELHIDSVVWEEGPRLRMHLKIFPAWSDAHSNMFNQSEVLRIRGIFTSWNFPRIDLFGSYELLNFTLLGPYAQMNLENHGRNIGKGIWVAIVLGAIISAVAVSALVSHLIARRHAGCLRKLSRRHLSSKGSIEMDGVKCFSFKEMYQATNNFDNSSLVGRGGYGSVYRGILGDNTIVAIKRAEEGSLQGQKEFLSEIKLLSRLHHRNLVSLIGYCDEEGEQLLVYEFMPNGTLRDWLSGKAGRKLDFSVRLSIAMGSAKGILYLHTEANPPVLHRDIKASNILLDSKLNAKVADFGLSRLASTLDDEGNTLGYVSTVVKGTPGYLDPEYLLTHQFTTKSDVYSLGIVFLELFTGTQPIAHGKNIAREVNVALQTGIISHIIDSKMGTYPFDCAERFIALALACCDDKPEKRPTMLDVVRELEMILKMMPETDSIFSKSISTRSGKSDPSSTFYVSKDLYASTSSVMIASDISSGVISDISPR